MTTKQSETINYCIGFLRGAATILLEHPDATTKELAGKNMKEIADKLEELADA